MPTKCILTTQLNHALHHKALQRTEAVPLQVTTKTKQSLLMSIRPDLMHLTFKSPLWLQSTLMTQHTTWRRNICTILHEQHSSTSTDIQKHPALVYPTIKWPKEIFERQLLVPTLPQRLSCCLLWVFCLTIQGSGGTCQSSPGQKWWSKQTCSGFLTGYLS